MRKRRLQAFSDDVIAIIITIMVFEFEIPNGTNFAALIPMFSVFSSYLLSFIYIVIYWKKHHLLLKSVGQVNGRILWANVHLLFWLSLIPFVTAWMGKNHFAPAPVAVYGTILLFNAIAYLLLTHTLISYRGRNSDLAIAIGRDFRGKISLVFYIAGILLSFVNSWLACALYVVVAAIWLIPDRRIENTLISGNLPKK